MIKAKITTNSGKNLVFDLPESFDEMSSKDFFQFIKVSDSTTDTNAVKLAMLLHFAGFKKWNWKNNNIFKTINEEQIHGLCTCLSWITAPFIYTEQRLPKFRIGFQTYYGPSSNLLNCKLDEVSQAHASYCNIHSADKINEDELNLFLAILYRPRPLLWFILKHFPSTNTGDCRSKFSLPLAIKRAKKFKKLPLHFKTYVVRLYSAVNAELPELYPHVFDGAGEASSPELAFYNIILSLSNSVAELNSTGDELMHNAMAKANADIKRNKNDE